ncbi:HMCN [Mytilus edulis]|uniref:HMCN n=1 Tax=Mytilus edulis TaxID=6550 RepID=A0A8S3QFV8_MYTED|nr:HMCN [Mytilus edulis]
MNNIICAVLLAVLMLTHPFCVGGVTLCIASCLAAVGGTALLGTTAILPAIGFASSGITAGSWAAAWMASFGGSVPAGGCFALFQSAGGVLPPLIEEADLTDWCQMSLICGRHGNLIHILGSLGRCLCNEGFTGSCCETRAPVTKTPIITLISNKTVVEGTAVVTIACNAEGIPAPVVTWEEIDAKLQPNVRQIGHFLVIENVTMANKGYYICTAKNRVGTEIKAVRLIVTTKTSRPYAAPVISAPSTVKVRYYTDARLVCTITGYPEPTVKWEYSKNKTIPGAKISGGILVIPNITSEATGLYTCIASNDIGSSRANIMLEATYESPKFVSSPQSYSGNTGAPHNFTCTATGHPVPKITWMFSSFSNHINKLPQHKIHRNGDMIELVNMEESGILTCKATNAFGIATAKAQVIVHHSDCNHAQIFYVIKKSQKVG